MKAKYKISLILGVALFFGGILGSGLDFFLKFPEYDIFLQALFGILGTLLGYYVSTSLKKPENKNDYTFSVFFAFWISSTLIAIQKLVQFFIDFYTGSNLLHSNFVDDSHWVFKLFGFAMSPHNQRPIFDTNEDFIISLSSSLLSAFFLYFYLHKKNKEIFNAEKLKKNKKKISVRISEKIEKEIQKVKNDCNIGDILFWWCTRAVMLRAFIVMENREEATLLLINLIGTFGITFFHMIFPENNMFNRISYKTQTLVTTMVFIGSWVGNYVQMYRYLPKFDFFMHFVAGYLSVIGGYYLAKTLINPENKKEKMLITLFAFCFAMFLLPFWEAGEFIGDFIWGTENQFFNWKPADESFFFKVFGHGVGNTQLYCQFDTIYDMLLALITTVVTTVGLYLGLGKNEILKNKRKIKEK